MFLSFLPPLTIFIVSILVFSNTLFHKFSYDDRFVILTNPTIKTLKALPWIFTHGTWPGELYRPITILSYNLTYYLSQLNPLPYHLTNILLHAIVCVLLFSILKKLFNPLSAFLVAIVFALHPIHTEAVANISYRSELLTNLFGLSFTYLLLHYNPENSRIKKLCSALLISITLLLSLLSKESGLVFLPIALLCLAQQDLKPKLRVFISASIPVLLVYFAMRFNALGGILSPDQLLKTNYLDNPLVPLTFSERVLNAFVLLGKYISLCFFPMEQSADYSFAKLLPINTLKQGFFNLTIFFFWVLATFSAIWFTLKRNCHPQYQMIAFWGLWFLFSFSITSNILFPIGTIFGERLAYLGSAAVCGLITEALILIKYPQIRKTLLLTTIVLFSTKTLWQNNFWYNDHTLLAREIGISSQSARTQNNFASSMLEQGNLDQALIHFQKALEIYPPYAPSAHGIAVIYFQKQNYTKAHEWINKTLELDPNFRPSIRLRQQLAAVP